MATTSATPSKGLSGTLDSPAVSQNILQASIDQIRGNWGWIVAAGVCLVVAGATAIAAPLFSSLAVEMLIASVLAVSGIAAIVAAFYARHWGGFFARIASGILHVAVGVAMAFNPLAGLVSLTMLVVIFFGLDGVLRIISAVESRKTQRGWIWILASGTLAIGCSGVIASQLPISSLTLIGVLTGVHLISSGWVYLMLGAEARQLSNKLSLVDQTAN